MTTDNAYITESEKQEYLAYRSPQDCLGNLKKGIAELENINYEDFRGKRLVCGGMIAFDKGISDFLNKWDERDGNLALLSEVTAQYRRYTAEKIKFPFICTPHLLAKEIVVKGMPLPVTREMKLLAVRKKFVRFATENMREKYPDLGDGYALCWGWYAYRYCERLLKRLGPSEVIMWNEFYPFHEIMKGCCREAGIPVRYMEFGCIPGTICVEKTGQQGESEVSRKYRKFRRLEISNEEKTNARQVLIYLKNTGLNRNDQPVFKTEVGKLKWWRPERKTVLFIGQNDCESGMFPYKRSSRKYHSPVFSSTLEGLEYFRILSEEEGWNLIYKPHPLVESISSRRNDNMDNIDVLTDVDINDLIDKVDLVVTILSQSAYIALIRGKPVLMLGYSQLRGKGCTYEAFSKNAVRRSAVAALENGFTDKQQVKFEQHVAQLLKYYLYDDNRSRPLRFGKQIGSWEKENESKTAYISSNA